MMTNYLENQTFMIYDSSKTELHSDLLSHFALGDALIRQANQENSPLYLHFWPIDRLVILGMIDTKLPYLSAGIHFLQEKKYDVVVRNAGGLAVIADPGVLNFSLVLPEGADEKITINEGYEIMLALIRQVFAPFGRDIQAFEISDSYCPGDYDLSIDGRKFAGIAQRRFKKGISIMIYLSVTGDQQGRGELIRSFYEKSLQGETTRWDFPSVRPSSMANLSDLLGIPFTTAQVQQMILETLSANDNRFLKAEYSPQLMKEYQNAHDKTKKRNQQLFENLEE